MKSKLFVVFLFLLVSLSISCVVATDLNNDTQDIIQISGGNESLASPPASIFDLKDQISNADEDSVVNITNDYVTTSSCSIDISGSLTIEGQGHTIDCSGNNQYLFVSNKGEITLKDLTIKNCKNTNSKIGGAIFIKPGSQWTIINCTFENNGAENYGGAIYNDNLEGTLTVTNSTFKNNKANSESGGAIFSKGEVVIEGCYFEGNTAYVDAGAIFCQKGGEITDTEFIDNKAQGAKVYKCFGGVVYAKEDISVEGCSFSNNVAENYGGAIYAAKDLIVIASNFTGNSAKEGGAIYGNGPHVFTDDSNFTQNSAKSSRGGAIYADKWLHVGNSIFESNTAKGKGGAIYTDFIKFDKENKFIKNSADGHGGAIYTSTISKNIGNIVFDGNHANSDFGGAIYINNNCGDIYLYNAVFTNNYAIAGDGGAIHSDSGSTNLNLRNCTFNGNYATQGVAKRYGGAICCKGSVDVKNSTFKDNWAQNRGGAIYCYKTFSCQENSYFINNRVYVDGGGAVYTDKLSSVKDTTFESSFSQSDGGAIYIDSSGDATIINSYFKNNHAKARGGAVYTDSVNSHLKLYNNAFVGNVADNQGSDVFCSGKYDKLEKNWWGTNSPSFSSPKLMEYKVFGSNKKHSDSNPTAVSLSGTNEGINYLPVHLKIIFTNDVPGHLAEDIKFSSDKSGNFSITAVKGKSLEFDYTPNESGSHKITIKVNSQVLTYTINVKKISVYGQDLVKVYGSGSVYSAVFLDSQHNCLPNGTLVTFNVDGINYTEEIHKDGRAYLHLNLDMGTHTVEAINGVTGESFKNQITVLPESKITTFNINDTYVTRFVVGEDEYADRGIATFTINGMNYTCNVTEYGWAFFKLNVAPGNYVVTVNYRNVTFKDNITVLNKYSKIISYLNGTGFGSLMPVYNNESFIKLENITYSGIGENTYRYVYPSSLQSFILYNVTVSTSSELTNVLRKMSKSDYNVDVTVINLKNGTYKITENFWKDREWYYLIHLTHGRLFINGNGATIEDGYKHNFIYGNPNTEISISNLTLKKFIRCFVNNGELYCANSTFIENDPRSFDTVTPGGVVYNLNKATFDHCLFFNNRNWESMVGWQSETRTQGGVLYAETNSFTSFIVCSFFSKHDNIYASNKSAVIFYDVNDEVLDFQIRNSYFSMYSSVCLRKATSLNSNVSTVLNYSDVKSLLNVHNDIKAFTNSSGYVINLENKTYTVNVKDYEEAIKQRKEWRTKILDPEVYYIPQNDKALLDMDTRAIIINGHGATIQLNNNNQNNDYHFAYVPKHSSLTLVNLTLKGFNSAILNFGTIYIVNCSFVGNIYHTVLDYDYGGAIQNYGGIYCCNSSFIGNKASKGAAIYSEGTSAQAVLMGCTFLNNKVVSLKSVFSPDKGTLYLTHNSVAKVIDCIGISEYYIETDDEGLCLFRESSEAAVYNVDIDSVSSLMKLSKLVSDNDEYDIINVRLVKGDYSVFPDSGILFEMDYGKLIINGSGSRIFVQNPRDNDMTKFLTTTIRSYVIINDLIIEGFNIPIENSGHLSISNTHFNNNKVDYKVKNDYGGAIVNEGTLKIFNSYFNGNYAKYGGAIYNRGNLLVLNSTFSKNIGYNSKGEVDIYTHEGNVEIISMGSKNPKTIEHFPMTQLQEDLLQSAVYVTTAIAVSAASYAITSHELNHLISTIVGAAIGGAFGAVHGAIYSDSHQDYGTFWTKVFQGVSDGMEFVDIGEFIDDHSFADKIDVFTRDGWIDVFNNLLDEFTSRVWELLSDAIDDEFLAGPPDEEINIIYVPRIL
ncbi:right-handed parallel beta-helix repeat-containing protein [Methanobrevibacter sp.]|uniref:right-handed parallel beta-helix repeat-containing protein n=1 Tax=Methanobrevibacter sp. TaxID=66852 RepID=UPI00386EB6A3